MKPLLLTIAILNGTDIISTNVELGWSNANGRLARENNPFLSQKPSLNTLEQVGFDAIAIPVLWKLHKNHPKLAWVLGAADVANALIGIHQNLSTYRYYHQTR